MDKYNGPAGPPKIFSIRIYISSEEIQQILCIWSKLVIIYKMFCNILTVISV